LLNPEWVRLVDRPAAAILNSRQENWLVHYTDAHVGTIANDSDLWARRFRPGSGPGECAMLAAASFDVIRAAFKVAILLFGLPNLPLILKAKPERYSKPNWRQ
jgi:hypothetical protein